MILEKFTFSFAFNLKKQNVSDFSFISLTTTLCCVFKLLLSGTVNGGLSDSGCSSVPLISVTSSSWYLAPPGGHI